MKIGHIITVIALVTALNVSADIPANYYSSINGKADAQLKTALSTLIYNHTLVSSYNDLPNYFKKTDVRPGTNLWWDMYSNIPVETNITFGKYMNREHAFPKSWWGGLTNTPAYTDLNHLYPSEAKANQAKSNYPLGEVSTSTFDNGVVKVGYAVTGQGGGAAQVFEPADEYKGDFARTYFYMVTCYQSLTWTTKYMYMLQQNDYPTLKPWAVDLLLKWHREDPVSEKEINRNEAVFGFQNNRNPFIDFPELAEYIWGNKQGNKFYAGQETGGDPVLITPAQGLALEFGEVAVGSTATAMLNFRGENLKGSLSLALSGTDKAMFSLPSKSIPASAVNAEGGFTLQVGYTPTTTGNHNARLIISDAGIEGSIGVQLIGSALPVPTLSTITALPASDITDDSYVANWETPDEVVDYYIIARTRYTNGTSSTENILAEGTSWTIHDFAGSDSESYNVRSVRLGYQSQPSNEIFVSHAGINSIEVDIPLGWAYYPGGIRVVTAQPQCDVRVYDLTGRCVMTLDEVADDDIIELPVGAYIITSSTSHTVMRVLVRM